MAISEMCVPISTTHSFNEFRCHHESATNSNALVGEAIRTDFTMRNRLSSFGIQWIVSTGRYTSRISFTLATEGYPSVSNRFRILDPCTFFVDSMDAVWWRVYLTIRRTQKSERLATGRLALSLIPRSKLHFWKMFSIFLKLSGGISDAASVLISVNVVYGSIFDDG